MNLLYLTPDSLDENTGGGKVTIHERKALQTLGDVRTISREELGQCEDPWGYDEKALELLQGFIPTLTHVYSGTFSKTVARLKEMGSKIVYSVVAHDRHLSREEYEKVFGLGSFPYKHLTDEALWNRYITGYRLADCIVCPSTHSRDNILAYGGCTNIKVIPHGCEISERYVEPPNRFIVGYLGAIGFDKGLQYLMEAWRKLNYKDDSMLVFAGWQSTSQMMYQMWGMYGGGNVTFKGWQHHVKDFYNKISLYVQPSITEGFGLEVLESMAYGRSVIASKHTCGPHILNHQDCFLPGNVDDLAGMIDSIKNSGMDAIARQGLRNHSAAREYTWDKIEQQYVDLWEAISMSDEEWWKPDSYKDESKEVKDIALSNNVKTKPKSVLGFRQKKKPVRRKKK